MFIVTDDIMDASFTRRGQPCWYKVAGVGNIAINDALMLECGLYFILKNHFRSEPYYVDVMELFHEVGRIKSVLRYMELTKTADHISNSHWSTD